MKIHESITDDRVIGLIEDDEQTGICVACGEDAEGVEPDARKYTCGACDLRAVYGAEELLLYLVA